MFKDVEISQEDFLAQVLNLLSTYGDKFKDKKISLFFLNHVVCLPQLVSLVESGFILKSITSVHESDYQSTPEFIKVLSSSDEIKMGFGF
jgi:hypothetical protein